ncbi:GntR family transcriptional regulator [Microvirga calopogonii]|uniref:GntR family transcriptional regulator n=1 Tax=Microvirga calopogonii TaxID=2078013 RepID=UPI001FE17E29|nr:GntR family transcriptional regulator [Microvirga calopogonii]
MKPTDTKDTPVAFAQREKPNARWVDVYSRLREAIVSHCLAPGMKLPEGELASIYSVSRTAIRSALQALAHDRLVKLEPNRGAFVAQPSKQEAREIFDARLLIEPRVAALAASAAKRSDIVCLRRHLEDEKEALHAGQVGASISLSARFHVAVAEVAAHTILKELVTDLVSRSSLIIALYWRRRDVTCESHAHHALVDALARHELGHASELMADHLADLVAGLDLTSSDIRPGSLAEVLR